MQLEHIRMKKGIFFAREESPVHFAFLAQAAQIVEAESQEATEQVDQEGLALC